MAVADEVRYQQIGHGFSKLTPVMRVSTGWRRTTSAETPDAIVSRVFGPNNFAIVVSGEIDGLTGLGPVGSTLGTPAFGRVVSTTSILVNIQSYVGAVNSTTNNANFFALENQVDALDSDVTALTASVSGKADASTTITGGLSVSGGGTLAANRTLSLLNDLNLPGNRKYYGTGPTGTKGWNALAPADITMSTARLLGRTTAGTGPVEEITTGAGLTFAAGVLNTVILRVDNLTALKGQAAPSATSTYLMQGYYAVGDGGEGTFNWFPGDTTPDNGGTVIQLTAGGTGRFKRLLADYDYINARSFGAKGDGTTNDTAAINAAITSLVGGTIFLPVGVYAISTPIQIHRGIRLLGAGPFDDISQAASTFFLKNGSNCAMLQTPSALSGGVSGSTHYMVLENLCFDGNAANQASETTNGAVQFWGAYVGSYVRNVFVRNARGPGFTLGGIGVDVQIDHLWVNDCVVATGYAFDTNQNLSGASRDGLLNMNHLYVENTSTVVGGDPRNTPSQRGKAIRLHRLVTANVDDVHMEATVYGISIESCLVVNIQTCHGAHIGNLTALDNALVSLVDNSTRIVNVGTMNTFNEVAGTFFVKKRTGVASNNIVFDMPMGTLPFGCGYSVQSDEGYGPSRHMATIIANQGGVQRVGGYSPTYWKMYSEADSTAQYGYLRQSDNLTSLGSNRGQPALAEKNFITISSFGNAGDKIDVSDPIYIVSRSDAGFLTNAALFNLANNPAWSRGSNLYENIATVVTGIVAPTAVTPLYTGQLYIDTVLNKPYISRGATAPSEWLALVTGASSGTVTSVALALPAEFSISGSPVTTTGTLTGAWATQTTNKVFAAPNGATGVPTFRALAAADIPALSYIGGSIASTQVAFGSGGNAIAGSANLTWDGTAFVVGPLATGVNLGGSPGGSDSQLWLKYDSINLQGLIQVESAGVGYRTLRLQPNGASVVIGTDPLGSELLRVGGSARVNGALTAVGAVTGSNLSGTNTGDQTIALTGDVTGSGTGSFAATLANVIAAGGPTGSTSVVPVLTWDAKGRLTAVTTATITAASVGAIGGSIANTQVAVGSGTNTIAGSADLTWNGTALVVGSTAAGVSLGASPSGSNSNVWLQYDSANTQGIIQVESAGVAYRTLRLQPNGAAVVVGADPLGSALMRVGGSLRVGSASANLAYSGSSLELSAPSTNTVFLTDTAASRTVRLSSDGNLGTTTAHDFQFLTGGLTRATIKSTGEFVTGARILQTRSVVSAAGTTTLDGTDHACFLTGATTHTFTLPAAAAGRQLIIKNRSTGALTVNRAGADTVDGLTTLNVAAGAGIILVANGTDWCVI